MKLHRLTRTIHIGPCGLRLGRLEIEPSPYTGRVFILWFRRRRTNLVTSFPYRKAKVPPTYITRTVYQELPQVDRDLDPDIAYRIAMMLDTYCVWLNKHLDAEPWPNEPRYNPVQFLDYRPTDQLYGSCLLTAMYESDYYDVVALNIYDGDEGGPTSLTGWWAEYYNPSGYDDLLVNMTQEFDTHVHFILNDREFTSLPTTKEPT